MLTPSERRARRLEREASRKRHEELTAQNRAIVATGKCPDCGAPLVRNMAIAGWYQCAAYPCLQMRKPEFKDLPKCEFQCFTE